MSKNPLLETIIAYQSRSVGVDMILKCFLNIFRLLEHFSASAEGKAKFLHVTDVILESRMLGNFGKPVLTFQQGLQKYKSYKKYCSTCTSSDWRANLCANTCFSSAFFRTLEQFFGDLGFLQKVVVHKWSRQKLSFLFAFFKSFSITLALISEIVKYLTLKKKMSCLHSCFKGNCHHLGITSRELQVSRALVIRSLCDMYVYYKWIPSYTPNRVLSYLCGFTSGAIGVWLVWKDHRYPAGYIPECPCGGAGRPQ